jgi:predicted PurR-regulated permease PerM
MVKHQKTIEQIAGLTLIGAIVLGCGYVLRPFVSAILWAAILCFATWPLHEVILHRLHGRRTLAAALMTAVLSLVLIIPFVVVGLTFTDSIHAGLHWLDSKAKAGIPDPPAWLDRIPLVGEKISQSWSDYVAGAESTIKDWAPTLKAAGRWLLAHSLELAKDFLHLVMSVLIAFFFYRDGVGLVTRLREAFQRISGDYSQHLIHVVTTTVRSVVYGVIGTALAQGIVSGIGFVIGGAPAPMLLALMTFLLSFLPFGPPIVWIGADIYLFAMGRTGAGIFIAIYGLLVPIILVDNVIKPYIISRGSKLSFIVMLIGILGGVAAFGFIGIFIGPTLLAVGFSLTQEILEQRRGIPAVALAQNEEPSDTVAPAPDSAADTAGGSLPSE